MGPIRLDSDLFHRKQVYILEIYFSLAIIEIFSESCSIYSSKSLIFCSFIGNLHNEQRNKIPKKHNFVDNVHDKEASSSNLLQEDIQVAVSANDIILKVEVDEEAWWATQGLVDPEKIALSDIKIDLNQDFGNADYFDSLKVSFPATI